MFRKKIGSSLTNTNSIKLAEKLKMKLINNSDVIQIKF